jgi:serine/threonine protein kinase
MNRCPACGTSYPAEARFCPRDGSRLVQGQSMIIKPPPPRDAVVPEPPAPVARVDLRGQVLDGRYEIERKVGEGGMSFVYLATDVATGEQCAIKVLSAELSRDENAMARLRREAGLGMRLVHANVCHIIRLGETPDGLVYVVMPFVTGELLSDRNLRRGSLPLDEVVRFVADIAAGLHAAHELAIVHRDLKPENVMIRRDPTGAERAVVMDFGLAKERRADAELQKLTATGVILGTPEFMSPEQLRGQPLDRRTDVYSLSLMIFEMLTGELPFDGRTPQEIMISRLRNNPKPLRTLRPDLPEAVERELLRAMSREADARHATAPELATALADAAAGRSTTGRKEAGGIFGRLFSK